MELVGHETFAINADYIRGLIDGEGCFTFCSTRDWQGNKVKIPSFILRMAIRDKNLIEKVRDFLGIKNPVHIYYYKGKDGYNRQPQAVLIVRDGVSLRRTIVPLFYKKLIGYKGIQFEEWIQKIGSDPDVPKSYKLIYRLHKNGFYDDRIVFRETLKS